MDAPSTSTPALALLLRVPCVHPPSSPPATLPLPIPLTPTHLPIRLPLLPPLTSLAPEQTPSAPAAETRQKPTEERNVQWVFLGCPGVSKGPYTSRLARLLGMPHIAIGDLIRDELASSGPLAMQKW